MEIAFIVQRLWVASRHVESAMKLFFSDSLTYD